MDLEKFFDRVNHDVRMARVARQGRGKRVLGLIRRYLQAGILAGGLVRTRRSGERVTPRKRVLKGFQAMRRG